MKQFNAPCGLSAYDSGSACATSDVLSCNRANFLEGLSVPNEYARLFVTSQPYNNCVDPRMALYKGTLFEDLYMPYTGNSSCPKLNCSNARGSNARSCNQNNCTNNNYRNCNANLMMQGGC
jgi:hypothetical protein